MRPALPPLLGHQRRVSQGARSAVAVFCICILGGGGHGCRRVLLLPSPGLPALVPMPRTPTGPKLMATVADFMVSTGLGSLPADFGEVVASAGLPAGAHTLARWEAYARRHMFDPCAAAPRM